MASIYFLNQPCRPSWDFFSHLEDHPFFSSARGPWAFRPDQGHSERRPYEWGDSTAPRGDDETTAGPSNDTGCRGGRERGRGRSCGSRGGGHHPHHHGRGRGGPMRGGWDPRHPRGGAFAHGPREGLFGGPAFHHDRHSHHDRGDPAPPPPEVLADLPAFLSRLGERLGFPIDQLFNRLFTGNSTTNQAASDQIDFTPSVDIFDTPTEYIVQVSLPGAKKPDLSIDYVAEESVLRLAGVVYRPGVTEDLHAALVVDERRNQVGVFEREVRLGTRAEPANVNAEGISAKLEDGVLVVTLPKIPAAGDQGKKKVRLESEEENDDAQIDEKRERVGAEEQDQHMQSDSETEKGDGASSSPAYRQASVEEYTPEGSDGEGEEEVSREYVHVDVQ